MKSISFTLENEIFASYSESSSAKGALFSFVEDENVDLGSFITVSKQDSAPIMISSGRYSVFAYDIETNGTLQDGINFPAAKHNNLIISDGKLERMGRVERIIAI